MTHQTLRGRRPARLAALAALLAAGCKDGGPKAADPGPLPPGTHAIEASARLPAPAVTGLCYSPSARVVMTSGVWLLENVT